MVSWSNCDPRHFVGFFCIPKHEVFIQFCGNVDRIEWKAVLESLWLETSASRSCILHEMEKTSKLHFTEDKLLVVERLIKLQSRLGGDFEQLLFLSTLKCWHED